MFVEFLIKTFFQSCSARTGFTPMNDKFVDLRQSQCKQSYWSGLCMSSPSPLHRLTTQHFDERYKRKQNESFLREPEHTIWVSRHRTLRSQYLHLVVFLWKQYIILASYKGFCNLIMYSFTHTNLVFLFRHLPAEIVIFINVCSQMKCFIDDSFSFFRSRFS